MNWLARWLGRPPPAPIDSALWQRQLRRIDGAAALPAERVARWHQLCARFLADKAITPAADFTLTQDDRLLIAMLCCEPVIDLGYAWLRGWHQVIVYPGSFGVRRQHLDEDSGVLHEWDDELIGESWDAGPLILSWADVEADLDDPHAGFCVAVHEMAHKLDALDGVLDGTPPLPRDWQRAWARDFQRDYDAFIAAVDAGRDVTIDPYAAEAPEEFFAVCSEYHFSDPAALRDAFPRVAAHFERFYGPPPAKSPVKSPAE